MQYALIFYDLQLILAPMAAPGGPGTGENRDGLSALRDGVITGPRLQGDAELVDKVWTSRLRALALIGGQGP